MAKVRQADMHDLAAIASLAHKLWPDAKEDDLSAELNESIGDKL